MQNHTIYLFFSVIIGTTLGRVISHNDNNHDGSYNFKYGVEDPTTGDIKSHHEVRVGKEVSGVYTLREADGTTRIVKYTAGPKKGFNAVVEKVGQPNSLTNLGNFGAFSGQKFGFHGFSTLQGGASEPVVAIIAQQGIPATPQYDFESIKVNQ